MVQFINNSIQFLKNRDTKWGLPRGIYLGLGAAAIAGIFYGVTLANSYIHDISEASYSSNVNELCRNYKNNLELTKEMGQFKVAELMEENCEESLEGFIR